MLETENKPEPSSENIHDSHGGRICPTRLIEDTPAEEDLIATGNDSPHERLAMTIADIIRSDEPGGKMIGIEGGWGAGKSTVIRMLQKHLESNDAKNNISVFTFDAWAHEGDPLRRTFLEALIRYFKNRDKWIDSEFCEVTLNKLSNKIQKKKKRTTRSTAPLGIWFGLSLLLSVPIGSSILKEALRNINSIDPNLTISKMLIVGLLLAVLPIIVLFINLIIILNKRKYRAEEGLPIKESSDWAFLSNDFIEVSEQEELLSPDPTSIEFDDLFCKLMDKVLPSNSNRKVVIVLDNLDRVDADDARSIWATLQTFLQDRSAKTEKWFSKLWIVVPYDPNGIKNIPSPKFKNEDNKDAADKDVLDSFLEKSFRLRFEVPPPVFSHWKAYLISLVRQALPEHNDDDQYSIYRVYNTYRSGGVSSPTPRKLKIYVNQIGAMHRQWQHEFPLGHIAYYVMLRFDYSQEDIQNRLRNGTFPDKNIESILSGNVKENLAGLSFNVDAKLGQQLLLSDSIINMLKDKDAKGLTNLETLHQDGFWAVFEDVITSQLDGIDATGASNMILCIDESAILQEQSRNEIKLITHGLGRLISSVNTWSPFSENLAKGISVACSLINDPKLSKIVINNLQHSIKPKNEKESPDITKDVIAGLVGIFKKLQVIGHISAISDGIVLPADDKKWIEICSFLHEHDKKLWPLFKPKIDFNNVSKYISTVIIDGQLSNNALNAIDVTQEVFDNCNWKAVAGALESRFGAGQASNSTDINILLRVLTHLRQYGCPHAQSSSQKLAESGHLMHGYHFAQTEKNVVCKARCIVMYLEFHPKADVNPSVGNSTAGYQAFEKDLSQGDVKLATQIHKLLQEQNILNLIFKVIDARGQYDPLIVQCLNIAAKHEISESLFTPKEIIKRWKRMKTELGNDVFANLIKYLIENTTLIKEAQEEEGGFDYSKSGLYSVICENSPPSFHEWCTIGLNSVAINIWESELENNNQGVLDFMLSLLDLGQNIELKQSYQDAHVTYAKKLLANEIKPNQDLIKSWPKILKGLEHAARAVLRSRLIKAAMDRDGKCADSFFSLYGEEIAIDALPSNYDKRIVEDLYSPLVRERAVGGLKWLNKVISENPGLLESIKSTNEVIDFTQRLQDEFKTSADESDEIHSLIIKIANDLGIKPRDKDNGNKE